MKNIKIIFTDLDGTLKDSNQRISIRHKRIIEKLANIGVPVVFTTGRNIPYTASLSKQFSASSYIISSNGAEIYNYSNENIIYTSVISKNDVKSIGELIKKYNLLFTTNYLNKIYTNKKSVNSGRKIINSIDEVIEENISQIILESDNVEVMKKVETEITNIKDIKISNRTQNFKNNNKNVFFDITNKNVSKGNAIKILCDYLKISLDKSMAIGDSNNDIEMLENARIKIAMNNATEDLKQVANYITLSNDQEGVAIILEHLYDELIK